MEVAKCDFQTSVLHVLLDGNLLNIAFYLGYDISILDYYTQLNIFKQQLSLLVIVLSNIIILTS